jgi:hypothetical protein
VRVLKTRVVLPCRKFGRFEAVGELLVGHQGLLGLVCTGTDERKPQVVGEEADLRKIRCSLKVPASKEWISSMTSIRTSSWLASDRMRWRSAVTLVPYVKMPPMAARIFSYRSRPLGAGGI